MLQLVSDGLTSVIGWAGTVVTALVSETGQLHDLAGLFGVGIAVSAFFMGVKVIKSITWGA